MKHEKMNKSSACWDICKKCLHIADVLSVRVYEYINLITAKMDFDEIFYLWTTIVVSTSTFKFP